MTSSSTTRIAIVDEQTLFRKGLVALLNSKKGTKVTIDVASGAELLKKLELTSNLPDICIMAITFPSMQGHATIQLIKKRWPSIKILLISTYLNVYSIAKLTYDGVQGYITKLCDPKQLDSAMSTILAGGIYLQDSGDIKDQELHSKPRISTRQIQFLSFCMTDLNYQEIAKRMKVSARTVDGYRETLFKNTKVKTRSGLIMFAIKSGIEAAQIKPDKKSPKIPKAIK